METIQDPKLLERYMVKSDIRTLFSGQVPRFFLLRFAPGELMTTPFSPSKYLQFVVEGEVFLYHNGTFYIINCNFSDRGNFIVTAKDPAGPWSAPHWLDDVPGIDASVFFDHDGRCIMMGTANIWPSENGVRLTPPYAVEITGLLKEGKMLSWQRSPRRPRGIR